MYPGLLHT
ncbi:hypothetical protein BDFB_014207 [Asbolus verrucosus]|uniref:Uncharacterized protein n=1 Tax=Asbolus verrucosus TaxID=1661398 RepID=A0A482V8A8_ASBVE|nr:hypothetical protein BDFB_014207 [Asbolus verrucosus]